MADVLQYARNGAPDDVLETFDWLADEGFVVRAERGGADAPFGNLVIDFERGLLVLRVSRDKSQWRLDVAPDGTDFVGLHVVLTAQNGSQPGPRNYRPGYPLPTVFPEEVSWHTAVPKVLSWLESGDRTNEIAAAQAKWRIYTKKRFGWSSLLYWRAYAVMVLGGIGLALLFRFYPESGRLDLGGVVAVVAFLTAFLLAYWRDYRFRNPPRTRS